MYILNLRSFSWLCSFCITNDPHRHGAASAAAMWQGEPDGDERLVAKLRGDLEDMAALKRDILDAAATTPDAQEAQA